MKKRYLLLLPALLVLSGCSYNPFNFDVDLSWIIGNKESSKSLFMSSEGLYFKENLKATHSLLIRYDLFNDKELILKKFIKGVDGNIYRFNYNQFNANDSFYMLHYNLGYNTTFETMSYEDITNTYKPISKSNVITIKDTMTYNSIFDKSSTYLSGEFRDRYVTIENNVQVAYFSSLDGAYAIKIAPRTTDLGIVLENCKLKGNDDGNEKTKAGPTIKYLGSNSDITIHFKVYGDNEISTPQDWKTYENGYNAIEVPNFSFNTYNTLSTLKIIGAQGSAARGASNNKGASFTGGLAIKAKSIVNYSDKEDSLKIIGGNGGTHQYWTSGESGNGGNGALPFAKDTALYSYKADSIAIKSGDGGRGNANYGTKGGKAYYTSDLINRIYYKYSHLLSSSLGDAVPGTNQSEYISVSGSKHKLKVSYSIGDDTLVPEVNIISGDYKGGSLMNVSTSLNSDTFIFKGWYIGNRLLAIKENAYITMPNYDATFIAVYDLAVNTLVTGYLTCGGVLGTDTHSVDFQRKTIELVRTSRITLYSNSLNISFTKWMNNESNIVDKNQNFDVSFTIDSYNLTYSYVYANGVPLMEPYKVTTGTSYFNRLTIGVELPLYFTPGEDFTYDTFTLIFFYSTNKINRIILS